MSPNQINMQPNHLTADMTPKVTTKNDIVQTIKSDDISNAESQESVKFRPTHPNITNLLSLNETLQPKSQIPEIPIKQQVIYTPQRNPISIGKYITVYGIAVGYIYKICCSEANWQGAVNYNLDFKNFHFQTNLNKTSPKSLQPLQTLLLSLPKQQQQSSPKQFNIYRIYLQTLTSTCINF